MKVVLLAGGFGTRISEESQYKPKPMIEIGGMPILWHIMKEYSYYGHNDFIICAGYKQEYIKEWFANYFIHNSDVTFDYRNGGNEIVHEKVPAISNLIFVHSDKKTIDTLKHTRAQAEPLRYMTRHLRADDGIRHEIIIVPDNQMDDFIHVASAPDDQRTFLTADDLHGHAGDCVVISSGPFAGVEGIIKRIKGNRRVVVEIAGVAGVCINFVPSKFIIKKE